MYTIIIIYIGYIQIQFFQVYMGELRNKCVKNVPDGWNATHDEWKM